MTRRTITTALAALALLVPVAACGGGRAGGTADPATGGTATTPAIPAVRNRWHRVKPGGGCRCANGSDFSLFERTADRRRVVLHFGGGGACWSAATCAQDGRDGSEGLYAAAVGEGPARRGGIFDLTDRRNPFADWSMVFVPYCTGDVFTGDAVTTYAPGLTIHHKGYADATAAVEEVARTFPHATEVVVTGLSAGAVAVPVFGAMVADRLPHARVVVLADSGGAYPPAAGAVTGPWNVGGAIPDWPENAGLTAAQWADPVRLWAQAARHAPRVRFARFNYAYDHVQATYSALAGAGSRDLAATIDANEAAIEAAGVHVANYTAGGEAHGVLQYGTFYTETVGGVRLVDWVARLVAGRAVGDVHCTDCRSAS